MQAGDFTAKKEIVWLERRGIEEGVSILSFEFRKQLFEYDEASNSFSKLAFPVEVSAPDRSQSMLRSYHTLHVSRSILWYLRNQDA